MYTNTSYGLYVFLKFSQGRQVQSEVVVYSSPVWVQKNGLLDVYFVEDQKPPEEVITSMSTSYYLDMDALGVKVGRGRVGVV